MRTALQVIIHFFTIIRIIILIIICVCSASTESFHVLHL